jgi:lipoyl synthase
VVSHPLRVRWLGRVPYDDGDVLQRALHTRTDDDYLLLLEHDHVYTLGTRAEPAHVLTPPSSVGAQLVQTDRGGDVTYHGPGQLVGYPIVSIPGWGDGIRDVVGYVRRLERVLVDALSDLGVDSERRERLTGVWVGDEKIAAIGVRVARGRTRHGFALNVDPDLSMFGHIVPCGIRDKGVTSVARLLAAPPSLRSVVDAVVNRFAERFGYETVERQDVAWRPGPVEPSATLAAATGHQRPVHVRLRQAGVEVPIETAGARRPPWMRVRADLGEGYRATQRLMRTLDLRTVCEEAGCPNIYECWAERTATFMILGARCTRACGFCLVDTRRPGPLDPDEPGRVARAVATLGLAHAVVTSVARDDQPDGGAAAFAATIRAIRARTSATVEVLIPDCKGDPDALDQIFAERPDVLNHNLETVARLQRAARPNAGYARSLTVLARAADAALITKSGLIVGFGETLDEVRGAIADLRAVGVAILTIGQYLRPSGDHLPVVRWWEPDEFRLIGDYARALGFAHVEAGPLVRSSYHARRASAAAAVPAAGVAS